MLNRFNSRLNEIENCFSIRGLGVNYCNCGDPDLAAALFGKGWEVLPVRECQSEIHNRRPMPTIDPGIDRESILLKLFTQDELDSIETPGGHFAIESVQDLQPEDEKTQDDHLGRIMEKPDPEKVQKTGDPLADRIAAQYFKRNQAVLIPLKLSGQADKKENEKPQGINTL